MPSRKAIAALALVAATARAADFEVRTPVMDVHELEYDLKLARGVATAGARSSVQEIEYGVNRWWSTAIEGEWERAAGGAEPTAFQALTFENRFRLTSPGEHWADLGLFVEYERSRNGGASAWRVGPILQKLVGPTVNVLDLLAVKESGPGARSGIAVSYAWQTRWILSEEFQPGFELYGGALEAGSATPRQHYGGPAMFGIVDLGGGHDLRYELGYLYGLDSTTPRTLKLLIGYEYRF